MSKDLLEYVPPEWAKSIVRAPTHRLRLANTPSPITPWPVQCENKQFNFYIKRDDLLGVEATGNKIRKLDFILADALQNQCDTTVTIGGVQSNHCRSTAVASRMVGMQPHIILRTQSSLDDPGLDGNLLVARMVGAVVKLVKVDDYRRIGSNELVRQYTEQLTQQGRKVCSIPVGGSNALGSWGYIDAVNEIAHQLKHHHLAHDGGVSDIVFACGSGGTAAGLALGVHLSGLGCKVHGVIVCDSIEWFHNHINGIFRDMGVTDVRSEDILHLVDGYRGPGYALNSEEELVFVRDVARNTGVLLDPVYSGKAARGMVMMAQDTPDVYKGNNIMFVHTGGIFSLFAKAEEMRPFFDKEEVSPLVLV